ncbi:MAG: DUF86 domain-containing protein [Chitinispirillales bacterium]|jgi:uncharacterized protein with HEPN domain|nr:DUF86 domain-containing protein [Chitinispirillales bacterium]
MPSYDRNKQRLKRIIQHCNEVEKIVARFGKSIETFADDFVYQSSCTMCIMQIGELSSRFSHDFQAQHTTIPWKELKGMRNIIVHEYDKTDYGEIWKTVIDDVPILKKQCEEILHALDGEG